MTEHGGIISTGIMKIRTLLYSGDMVKSKVRITRRYSVRLDEHEVTALHNALRIAEASANNRAFEIGGEEYANMTPTWTELRIALHEMLRTPDDLAL